MNYGKGKDWKILFHLKNRLQLEVSTPSSDRGIHHEQKEYTIHLIVKKQNHHTHLTTAEETLAEVESRI